jgi:hypothetical protein
MKSLSKISLSIFALALFLELTAAPPSWAAHVPSQIHFQGRLTDASNNPLTGSNSFVFGIYDAPTSGNLLWTEAQPAVAVANGVFAAQLGSVTPLLASVFSGATAYLQITVNGNVMLPREQLLAAPYAHDAELLDGRFAGAFVSTDATSQNILGAKTFASSVTASAFFGDGSHLTGVAMGSFVPTAGGAMTGPLTISGASETVTGAGGLGVTYGLSAGSVTVSTGITMAGAAVFSAPTSTVVAAAFIGSGALLTNLPSGVPTGAAGGNLTGAYPNPIIGSQVIVTTHIANGAITNAQLSAGTFGNITGVGPLTNAPGLSVTYGVSAGSASLSGNITASSATFTATGTSYSLSVSSGIKMAGAALFSAPTSTIVASAFVGSGAGLTNLPGGASAWTLNAPNIDELQYSVGVGSVPAAGVGFAVGGSSFVVLQNGYVGVGTSSPAENLEVNGVIQADGDVAVPGDGAAHFVAASDPNTGMGFSASASANLSLFTSGTTAPPFVVLNGGNVGVSTGLPQGPLDVNGSALFGAGASKSTFTATPGGAVYALQLSSGISLAAGGVRWADGTISTTAASGGAGSFGSLLNSTNAWTAQQTFAGEISLSSGLVVYPGGSYTAPPAQLTVDSRFVTNNVAAFLSVQPSVTIQATGGSNNASLYLQPSFAGVVGTNNSTPLYLQANSRTVMALTAAGSAGIETTSPAATLDVNGNAQFGLGAAKSTFTAAGDLQVSYGVTAASGTFTAAGTNYSVTVSSGINMTGPAVFNAPTSSVVAAGFIGSGAGLTNLPGGAGVWTLNSPNLYELPYAVGIGSSPISGMGFVVGPSSLTVLQNGFVGIGTSNPSQKVEIDGGTLRLNSGGANGYGELDMDAGTQYSGAQIRKEGASLWAFKSVESADAAFFTDNVNTHGIYVRTGGNVGLGTTSPAALLDVNGSAQFGAGATKSTFTATGVLQLAYGLTAATGTFTATGSTYSVTVSSGINMIGAAVFNAPTSTMVAASFIGSGAGLTNLPGGAGSWTLSAPNLYELPYSVGIGSVPAAGVSFAVGASSMTILQNGNVGIGTSSPGAALEVDGNGTLLLGSGAPQVEAKSGPLSFSAGLNSDFAFYTTAGSVFIANGGEFLGAGGSVSSPMYSFNGDTGTGLYLPSSHAIGFVNNGIEAMRIASGGYVGVGTTNPTTLFEVGGGSLAVTTAGSVGVGTTNPTSLFDIEGGANNTALTVGSSSGGGTESSIVLKTLSRTNRIYLADAGATGMGFVSGSPTSSTNVFIADSGAVGIGNTSPQTWVSAYSPLQLGQTGVLIGQSNAHNFEFGENWYRDAGSTYRYLNGAASPASYAQAANGTWNFGTAPVGTAGSPVTFGTGLTIDINNRVGVGISNPTTLFEVGSGSLAVAIGGNVGIGTSSPAAALHIEGSSQIEQKIQTTASAISRSGWLNANYSWAAGEDSVSNFHIWENLASPTTDFTILSGGNVGIGTTNPLAALEVVGVSSFTTSITVNGVQNASVPAGMVSFFNLSACPTGWSSLVGAQGRYLVGLNPGGTLAGSVGTALTDEENRPTGVHSHGITDPGHAHGINAIEPGSNNLYGAYGGGDISYGTTQTYAATTGITVNNSAGVAGTNAPYLQLLVCQKN